ncbi:hypothetical protein BDV12DRAFT_198726 [Aspergillus spectabilis]
MALMGLMSRLTQFTARVCGGDPETSGFGDSGPSESNTHVFMSPGLIEPLQYPPATLPRPGPLSPYPAQHNTGATSTNTNFYQVRTASPSNAYRTSQQYSRSSDSHPQRNSTMFSGSPGSSILHLTDCESNLSLSHDMRDSAIPKVSSHVPFNNNHTQATEPMRPDSDPVESNLNEDDPTNPTSAHEPQYARSDISGQQEYQDLIDRFLNDLTELWASGFDSSKRTSIQEGANTPADN